ncbi:hypothetical protein MD484_g7845, partial [Candolleomyces efflorescens]
MSEYQSGSSLKTRARASWVRATRPRTSQQPSSPPTMDHTTNDPISDEDIRPAKTIKVEDASGEILKIAMPTVTASSSSTAPGLDSTERVASGGSEVPLRKRLADGTFKEEMALREIGVEYQRAATTPSEEAGTPQDFEMDYLSSEETEPEIQGSTTSLDTEEEDKVAPKSSNSNQYNMEELIAAGAEELIKLSSKTPAPSAEDSDRSPKKRSYTAREAVVAKELLNLGSRL